MITDPMIKVLKGIEKSLDTLILLAIVALITAWCK
jgi:hypothetical protein